MARSIYNKSKHPHLISFPWRKIFFERFITTWCEVPGLGRRLPLPPLSLARLRFSPNEKSIVSSGPKRGSKEAGSCNRAIRRSRVSSDLFDVVEWVSSIKVFEFGSA